MASASHVGGRVHLVAGEDGEETSSVTKGVFVVRRYVESSATRGCVSAGVAVAGPVTRSRGWDGPSGNTGGAPGGNCGAGEAAAPELATEACVFPQTVPGEPPATCVGRWRAYQRCWSSLQGRLEAVLSDSHGQAFDQLLTFARARSAVAAPPPQSVTGPRALPTALLLAGGVNQADHELAFAALQRHLRAHGCHAALLRSPDLGARAGGAAGGPGLSHTLRCVLSQLTASASSAPRALPSNPTTATLAAWHAANNTGSASKPLLVLLEDTECCHPDALADLIQALSEAGAALPVVLVLGVATSPAMLQALLPARCAARLDARLFRLWSAVARLECVQRDVLLGCGGRGRLAPASGGGAAGQQAGGSAQEDLPPPPPPPPADAHRVWPRTMPLPLLDGRCAGLLHERFVEHDFSLVSLCHALHLASLLHFATCPLANLLTVVAQLHSADARGEEALGGGLERKLRGVVQDLCPQLASWAATSVACLQGCPREQAGRRLAAALRAFGPASVAWGAAVACLAFAAEAVECGTSHALGLRELFRDAAQPGFVTSRGGRDALQHVLARLQDPRRCPDARLLRLLHQWAAALVDARALRREQERVATLVKHYTQLLRSTKLAARQHARHHHHHHQQPQQQPQQQQQRQQRQHPSGAAADEGAADGDDDDGGGGGGGGGPRASQPRASLGAKPGERSRKELRAQLLAQADRKSRDEAAQAVAAASGAPARGEPQDQARNMVLHLLRTLIAGPLASPPASLDGQEILVLSQSDTLAGYLQAAPRPTLENALLMPGHEHFLSCSCCPRVAGKRAAASMPDAAAAYSLLAGMQAEFVNVHDWFQAFIQLHLTAADKPAGGAASGKGKKRGRGGAAADEEDLPSSRVSRQRLWELQARFERALVELRHMGFIRPARKKRGEHMQRLVFGTDTQAEEDGL